MKINELVQITMNHDWTGRVEKLLQDPEWREFAHVPEGLGYQYIDCMYCEWNDSTVLRFSRTIEQNYEIGGEAL